MPLKESVNNNRCANGLFELFGYRPSKMEVTVGAVAKIDTFLTRLINGELRLNINIGSKIATCGSIYEASTCLKTSRHPVFDIRRKMELENELQWSTLIPVNS